MVWNVPKFQPKFHQTPADLPVSQVKNIIVLFLSGISGSARETTISPLSSFSGSPHSGTKYQLLNENTENRADSVTFQWIVNTVDPHPHYEYHPSHHEEHSGVETASFLGHLLFLFLTPWDSVTLHWVVTINQLTRHYLAPTLSSLLCSEINTWVSTKFKRSFMSESCKGKNIRF